MLLKSFCKGVLYLPRWVKIHIHTDARACMRGQIYSNTKSRAGGHDSHPFMVIYLLPSMLLFYKKSAILCQFTNLRAVTTLNICWTGSLMCISHHLKFSPELEPIASKENNNDMEKCLQHHIFVRLKQK